MSTQTILEIDHPSVAASLSPTFGSFEIMLHNRPRREVRSHDVIMLAILEACRTPTVQHWIMVKARLGYDTFWKHMNRLLAGGLIDEMTEGSRTLYQTSSKGLELLVKLSAIESTVSGP